MPICHQTRRFPGIKDVPSWFVFLLGLTMVFSSWFSIQLSTDQQYREMLAMEAAHPGHLSGEKWISSEMDWLPKLLGLLSI
jgi:hypothetical protein